jgi:hypothetical protein
VAYHYFRTSEQLLGTVREYNIDYPVGAGAANLKDDVMLVQTLLHILYFETDPEETGHNFTPLPGEEIAVSGECDPTTRRYIVHFKKEVMRLGWRLHPDEVFDPMRDNEPNKKSTLSKTYYAFSRLLNVCGTTNPRRTDNIPEERSTPRLLAQALRQTRRTARKYGGV